MKRLTEVWTDHLTAKRTAEASMRALISRWRRKASEQGSVSHGSFEKARTYDECADDLEELVDSLNGGIDDS